MALATLLHLDQFNFGSDEPVALVSAWGWTLVYLVAPVASGVLLSRQLREPGVRPRQPARRPSSPGCGYLFLAQGALLALVGVVLFVRPGHAPTRCGRGPSPR